ncbi:MAG: D-glycero-beta-D-manno-heptose 1-phosphate adenylyltransferase [Candidatus Caenarcaniphilales bacterium]|nr:D-glycero-beta-D-manno-heptose 1-phosphate adenylyltransferase [Candidatus Caenarcaniphilales bacterium]
MDKIPLSSFKEQNKKIVLTNGCFDILHVGHVRYLQEARKLGDILIVGVNSDQSVQKLKGESRPINKDIDRAEILKALSCVDYTWIFEEETADELIEKIQPSIYVKGGDYKEEDLPEYMTLKKLNVEVVFVNFHDGHSTTSIINRFT